MESSDLSNVSCLQEPSTLTKEGGYSHLESSGAGKYPTNGAIRRNLYYVTQDLCDFNFLIEDYYPVDVDEDGTELYFSSGMLLIDPEFSPTCSWVDILRTAQRSGADSVLLVNEGDPIEDPWWNTSFYWDRPLDDIYVPIFIISQEDANSLKRVLTDGEDVLAEMAFGVPEPERPVQLHLVLDPTDDFALSFLSNFGYFLNAFEEIQLSYDFYMYGGSDYGCTSKSSPCESDCTNGGLYCATVPARVESKGVHGSDIVAEILRQDCIRKAYDDPTL